MVSRLLRSSGLVLLFLLGCGPSDQKQEATEVPVRTFADSGTKKPEVENPTRPGASKEELKQQEMERRLLAQFGKATSPERRAEMLEEIASRLPTASRDLLTAVQGAMVDPDEMVRASALRAFVAFEKTAALAPLAHALADESVEVRRVAVQGWKAAGLKDPAPLVARFRDEFDDRVLMEIAGALRQIGDVPPETLASLLEDVTSLKAARILIDHLADRGSPAAIGRLPFFATRNDPEVRQSALRALGKSGEKSRSVLDALVTGLSDEVLAVRIAALEGLKLSSGQTFPFDPDASEALRKDALTAWKAWVETQKP